MSALYARVRTQRREIGRPRSTRPRKQHERIQKENERISTIPFLLWHFSRGDTSQKMSRRNF